VAPLAESCPPKLYEGTERIVSFLIEEMVWLGHDVALFAKGDSVQTGVGPVLSDRTSRSGGSRHAITPRCWTRSSSVSTISTSFTSTKYGLKSGPTLKTRDQHHNERQTEYDVSQHDPSKPFGLATSKASRLTA
jgi:hypothetical protein